MPCCGLNSLFSFLGQSIAFPAKIIQWETYPSQLRGYCRFADNYSYSFLPKWVAIVRNRAMRNPYSSSVTTVNASLLPTITELNGESRRRALLFGRQKGSAVDTA